MDTITNSTFEVELLFPYIIVELRRSNLTVGKVVGSLGRLLKKSTTMGLLVAKI